MKSYVLTVFTLLTLFFSFLANAKDATDLSSESLVVLEDRFSEIKKEKSELNAELRDLRSALAVISNIHVDLETVLFDKIEAVALLDRLKEAHYELKNLPSNTMLSDRSSEVVRYRGEYENLLELSNMNFSEIYHGVRSILPSDGSYSDGERIIDRITRNQDRKLYKGIDLRSPIDNLLYDVIPVNNAEIITSKILDDIEVSGEYLNSYSVQDIENHFDENKKRYLEAIQGIYDEIKKAIDHRVDRNKKLLSELDDISQAIDKKREKQTIIDQGLIYAVYGMILSLLLMFLALRLFNDNVAVELIKRRSLIEIVGMAFMLITIIILGTGERINTETLGTLLGTIAGYIFGRIGADRSAENSFAVTKKLSNNNDQPKPKTDVVDA